VARNRRNPVRLVIALSVAAVLAVFLLYSSIAGGGTPSVQPSELKGRTSEVQLAGRVIGPVSGDAHQQGLRFRLRDPKLQSDPKGTATVAVVYKGSVPDLFRVGRDILVKGRLVNGTFVTSPGSMITKCPSKYVPKQQNT
jgi:cytochrome c-type biogenesis protein CcmE